jgi:hypothetical protein
VSFLTHARSLAALGRSGHSRWQYGLFFLLVAVVVAAALVLGRPAKHSILDAVPRDAWLVISIDAASLRQSSLAKPLLSAGDKAGLLGPPLTATCGFDPLERIRELAVASPESGERGDFGVAFAGSFTKDELVACASRVITKRGGTPSVTTRGTFAVVEDTSDARHSRLAYRDGGPFLVGRGAWLDAMMDAVQGTGERMRPEHAALRAELQAAGGGPARSVVLTALLPASLRDKLKAELGSELAENEKSNATFSAVLGVSAVGIAVGQTSDGATTELAARLRCETASACDLVQRFIERKRLALARDFALRAVGLGPLLDSLEVTSQGPALSAKAQASSQGLADALERALSFVGHAP